METRYDVKADLTLDTTRAISHAVNMQRRIQELGRRIRGTSSLASGLTRNLLAIGATYVGVNVLIRGFAGLTRGAMDYASELEKTRIGLTAVLAAVHGTDWATAARVSGQVFEQVRQDSIKSVATAQQLFTIYQGIVGPIAQAGKGLEVVRKMTLDTVTASGVLGVDLAQAQRDISMMVRGTAGMDVKLFNVLRSTGAIVETTEEWNKSLSAGERIDKLQAALAKFAPAGDRFAKSWAGVTSTFKGIRQEFTRSAMQPIMDAMAASLRRVNDSLIENQDRVVARLSSWGERTAKTLDTVFRRAEAGVNQLINNWDQVLARARELAGTAGTFGKGAALLGAAQIARGPAGMAVGAFGAAMPFLGRTGGGIAGAARGKFGRWAATDPLGFGPGKAAGVKHFGAGAFSPAMGLPGAAVGVAAGGGGGAAAAGGVAALGPVIAVAAVALAAFASVALVVQEQWGRFTTMFEFLQPIMAGLGTDVMALGVLIWETLAPALKVFGHLLGSVLVAAFVVILVQARLLVRGMKLVFGVLANVSKIIYAQVKPAFDLLWEVMEGLVMVVSRMVGGLLDEKAKLAAVKVEPDMEAMARMGWKDYAGAGGYRVASTPGARTTVINDFRGSKIDVKQVFKDQDPDRVLMAMAHGISRQAEMRIQSGMVPALSR